MFAEKNLYYNSKLLNVGEYLTVITYIVKQFDSEYNLTSFK